jgi:hypothetical protein
VLEKGVLRRLFGPKREEVMGGWGKELYNLYSLPNMTVIIKLKLV